MEEKDKKDKNKGKKEKGKEKKKKRKYKNSIHGYHPNTSDSRVSATAGYLRLQGICDSRVSAAAGYQSTERIAKLGFAT